MNTYTVKAVFDRTYKVKILPLSEADKKLPFLTALQKIQYDVRYSNALTGEAEESVILSKDEMDMVEGWIHCSHAMEAMGKLAPLLQNSCPDLPTRVREYLITGELLDE